MSRSGNLWWRLVRFGFRLLYNEMAFSYDVVSWIVSMGSWRCWQQSALAYLPDTGLGQVLELAHGTGNLQLDLFEAGYSTIGYDRSAAMGHIAARKLSKIAGPPRLVRGMAQELPFPRESFSAIVSTFPTDFIIEAATLSEAYRVLKPDGKFVVVLNGVLVGTGLTQRLLEWLFRITGQREAAGLDIREYFLDSGFSVNPVYSDCPGSQVQLVILTKESRKDI